MSASIKNLLVELLVEELPPKSLKKIGDSFAEKLASNLKVQGLAAGDAVVTVYASPRRIAAHVTNVAERAADKSISQKLMPLSVGLDKDNQPTAALLKKLSSLGVDASAVQNLKREADGKTETLYFDSIVRGTSLSQGLQKALDDAIAGLPIDKLMTYQLADGWSSLNFIRPAHGLLVLHGEEVVPVRLLGLDAGRLSQGHRFESASTTIHIRDSNSYESQMEKEGAVIPSFGKRRTEIARQLMGAAIKMGGLVRPIEDDTLLDEVTALVERPNVLVGEFDDEFLEVPQECLILTMKSNQKYFPLLDASGKITNKFLIVSNISPVDASLVIRGNERVLRARLADARFFFNKDRKNPLDSHVLDLAKVVYHNKLGSLGDRVKRVQSAASRIATELGGEELARQADQAALLSKADLLTDMVGEFPELQGIMGRYYAQHDGLNDDIAFAIEDHYKPRFSGDELPRNTAGICLALADKLTTLIDLFGIGEIPTGDKDPFALRRHALGIIRMLIDRDLPFGLNWLLHEVCPSDAKTIMTLSDFMYTRLAGSLREQGYSVQEVDALVSLHPQRLGDLPRRLAAVRAFTALPESVSLAAANKRVGNILKKVNSGMNDEVNITLLQEPAEQALHHALSEISPKADKAFTAGDYTTSLQILASLKDPVDTFFNEVMVNTEDIVLRTNRLALLQKLQYTMNRVADISKLAN